MAGQSMGVRQTPRFLNNFNDFQNQLFQQSNLLRNLLGPTGAQATGVEGANGKDPLLAKLEALLKQFLDATQAQNAGVESKEGGHAGGAEKAGGGHKAAGQDAFSLLEELLRQLRELAQTNPQALQQFLAQNPELAQMIGTQLGGAGAGGVPAL